jgi:hypothetical protein
MYISVGWLYFFHQFAYVMACVNELIVCMYVVVVFSLRIISFGVFLYAGMILMLAKLG